MNILPGTKCPVTWPNTVSSRWPGYSRSIFGESSVRQAGTGRVNKQQWRPVDELDYELRLHVCYWATSLCCDNLLLLGAFSTSNSTFLIANCIDPSSEFEIIHSRVGPCCICSAKRASNWIALRMRCAQKTTGRPNWKSFDFDSNSLLTETTYHSIQSKSIGKHAGLITPRLATEVLKSNHNNSFVAWPACQDWNRTKRE